MEREFVSYEQAVALKKLGFDEDCFAGYDTFGDLWIGYNSTDGIEYNPSYYNKAPLKQQVFRWFREKYEFFQEVSPMKVFASDKTGHRYIWCIYDIDQIVVESDTEILGYYSYEEAENACIDVLIESVKQQGK